MFFCAADFIFCFGFKVLVYIILKNPFKDCRTCHQLWSSGSSSVSAVITRHSHPREALPRSINSREYPITHQELLPFYKVCLVGVKIGKIFPFSVTRLVLGEDRFFLLFVQFVLKWNRFFFSVTRLVLREDRYFLCLFGWC